MVARANAIGWSAALEKEHGVPCNLAGKDLTLASLSGAKLTGVDLSGATLHEAKAVRADLSGATLVGADLSGATLVEATLRGADLTGADVSGADLRAADLRDAKLDGTRGLDRARLKGVVGLPETSVGSEAASMPTLGLTARLWRWARREMLAIGQ